MDGKEIGNLEQALTVLRTIDNTAASTRTIAREAMADPTNLQKVADLLTGIENMAETICLRCDVIAGLLGSMSHGSVESEFGRLDHSTVDRVASECP